MKGPELKGDADVPLKLPEESKAFENLGVKEGGVKKTGRQGFSPKSDFRGVGTVVQPTLPVRVQPSRKSHGFGKQSIGTPQQSPRVGRLTQSAPSETILGQSPGSSYGHGQQGSILRKQKSDMVSIGSRIKQPEMMKQTRFEATEDDGSNRQKRRKVVNAASTNQITDLLTAHGIGSTFLPYASQDMTKYDPSKLSQSLIPQNSPPGSRVQSQTSAEYSNSRRSSSSIPDPSSESSFSPSSPQSSASSTSSEDDKRRIPRTKKSFRDLWALDSKTAAR